MATGQDIIRGALRHAGILEDEEPITASMLQDGLEDLNDWGILFESSTLPLGFTPLDAVTETINIPREAEGAYKANLGVYLCAQYDLPITTQLATIANDTKRMAIKTFRKPFNQSYPDTLPKGSGNDDETYTDNQRYFPTNQDRNF